MALPMHQWYQIVFLSQHPLSPKLGHKSVAKVVKCSTSTVQSMETVKRSGRFSSNWPSTCNDSKTGSADSLAYRTTDIRYKPRYYEPTEQKTSQDQRTNGATALERRRRKVQSASVKTTTHRKS